MANDGKNRRNVIEERPRIGCTAPGRTLRKVPTRGYISKGRPEGTQRSTSRDIVSAGAVVKID